MINCHQGFRKCPDMKQSPTLLKFSFLIDCCKSAFFSLFFLKAFVNFEKSIRFHQQAFIIYKNGISPKTYSFYSCFSLSRPSET